MAAALLRLRLPYIIRPRPAWAQSEVLNVTTYDKFLPQEFIDKFQKDTGIEVQRPPDRRPGQAVQSARRRGRQSVDRHRHRGRPPLSAVHRARSCSRRSTPASITNWKNLNTAYQDAPWARINGKLWGMPILAGFEGLARNTDHVEGRRQLGASCSTRKYKGLTSYIVSDFLSVVMHYLGYDGDFVTYVGKPEEAQKATNEARDFLIKNKDMVRKYYDAGSEVQQMFINEDIYLAQTWSGPAAKLIMDGHPIELSVPKEGTYGFVYTLNIVNNAPNADNAYKFLDAVLASPGSRRGDDAPVRLHLDHSRRRTSCSTSASGWPRRCRRSRSSASLLQLGQPRHEERDDRPRDRRGQGGLTTSRTLQPVRADATPAAAQPTSRAHGSGRDAGRSRRRPRRPRGECCAAPRIRARPSARQSGQLAALPRARSGALVDDAAWRRLLLLAGRAADLDDRAPYRADLPDAPDQPSSELSGPAGREATYTLANYALFFTEPLYFLPFIRSFDLSPPARPRSRWSSSTRSPTTSPRSCGRSGRTKALLLLLVPFWAGEIIRTFSVIMLLANRGAVNMLLREIGLIDRPIPMLYTYFSLSFGVVYLVCLYMLLPLYSAIEKIPSHLLDAAADLGAGPFTRFRRIVLPLSRDGIVSGCSLVFLTCIGVFATPMLLGGPNTVPVPRDDRQLLPRRQRQMADRRRLRDDHAGRRADHRRLFMRVVGGRSTKADVMRERCFPTRPRTALTAAYWAFVLYLLAAADADDRDELQGRELHRLPDRGLDARLVREGRCRTSSSCRLSPIRS